MAKNRKNVKRIMTLNIVLVEPQIPQNTGNIARTCSVTGAGLDYWGELDITYYENLDDFYIKNNGSFYYFTTKARHNYCDIAYPDNCYLFFGREDAGLPEELLKQNPENCVRIPMRKNIRSLNLSNSVAIGVYETLRQWGFPELEEKGNLARLSWDDANES